LCRVSGLVGYGLFLLQIDVVVNPGQVDNRKNATI
jgi:hypothetical protein